VEKTDDELPAGSTHGLQPDPRPAEPSV